MPVETLLIWLIVGAVAGWLAGVIVKGGGFGLIGDIVVGLIGAVVGGFVFSLIAPGVHFFWGSVVVAFIGACILIWLVRLISVRRAASRVPFA